MSAASLTKSLNLCGVGDGVRRHSFAGADVVFLPGIHGVGAGINTTTLSGVVLSEIGGGGGMGSDHARSALFHLRGSIKISRPMANRKKKKKNKNHEYPRGAPYEIFHVVRCSLDPTRSVPCVDVQTVDRPAHEPVLKEEFEDHAAEAEVEEALQEGGSREHALRQDEDRNNPVDEGQLSCEKSNAIKSSIYENKGGADGLGGLTRVEAFDRSKV